MILIFFISIVSINIFLAASCAYNKTLLQEKLMKILGLDKERKMNRHCRERMFHLSEIICTESLFSLFSHIPRPTIEYSLTLLNISLLIKSKA